METYSTNDIFANWTARRLGSDDTFEVFHNCGSFGRFRLSSPGAHNVMNALATIATCTFAGIDMQTIREGLATFNGALRRFQIIGNVNGVTVIDDYGHHPTEIRATLGAARERFPDSRIWCVFQPHQFCRTKSLLKDFAHSFGNADKVVLTDIYSARDKEEDKAAINSHILANEIGLQGVDATYVSGLDDVPDFLTSQLRTNDVVITMGAGDIGNVSYRLVSKLQELQTTLQDATEHNEKIELEGIEDSLPFIEELASREALYSSSWKSKGWNIPACLVM